MIYDITRPTPPEMPTLGKGLETQKLLLSQTSKDMFQPEHPMLYAPLGAKMSGAEFQYPSGQWLEPCGQISLLCADSGNNKGQHTLLVEAIMREELRSDQEAINKYVEWQKASHAANKNANPPRGTGSSSVSIRQFLGEEQVLFFDGLLIYNCDSHFDIINRTVSTGGS